MSKAGGNHDVEDPLLPPALQHKPAPTQTIRIVAVVLVPWLSFVFLLTIYGFRFHDYSERGTWLLGVCFLLATISVWLTAIRKLKYRPQTARWTVIQAVLLAFATLFGVYAGDYLYWSYMWNYYRFQRVNSYVNVDPSKAKGQTVMDAGQVYFKEGTFVAAEEAIAYEMKDIYCAAPIVRQPVADQNVEGQNTVAKLPSGTIDFWAVGVNCCMPSGERFRCFDSATPNARSGLRLLRDDLRPFFKLAVEEWSSKNHMPVKHPLFFYWLNDPLATINSNLFSATWRYNYMVQLYFVFNAVLVYVLLLVVNKMGW